VPDPAKAFICYRRGDAFVGTDEHGKPDYAFVERVKQALETSGFEAVFLDVDPGSGSIPLHHYEKHAFEEVKDCDLFVAVIGTKWLELFRERAAQAKEGRRDATLREIRAAVRFEKLIFPLLVDGATMPGPEVFTREKELADFPYQHAQAVPSSASVETLVELLRQPTAVVARIRRINNMWRNIYICLCIAAYYFCAINTHIVGVLEYGWKPWFGMARAWGGFFLWPIFFLPFALVALYRPLNTLMRFVVAARTATSRRIYLTPILVGTGLAIAAWALEVYDPRQVPWTIYPVLPQPGCEAGPQPPRDLAALPDRDRQRWQVLSDLSNYDKNDDLKLKYANSEIPFWLNDKCWPNVFFYLTAPVYAGFTTDRYLAERPAIQQSFTQVLNDKRRIALGVGKSWSSWAYEVSFFFLVWLGLTGVTMSSFYAMVALRDPDSDMVRSLPTEDAALCLTYSLGTLMTWLPFRMITEYAKYLYTCHDLATCEFDIALYLPDCLLGSLLLIGYLFVTVCLFGRYRRVVYVILGLAMVAASLAAAFVVYNYRDSIARLAELWQFYVLLAIPTIIVLFTLWFYFNPAAVHTREFEKEMA
jgi:hypothetical protein